MRDFYLTLPSNSSMKYHPENKTSSFTVQLSKYVALDGDWSVGLVDIHYPYTFFNITTENNKITAMFLTYSINVFIPPGWYSDIKTVINEINKLLLSYTNNINYLTLDQKTMRIKVGQSTILKKISFHKRLALQLGFEPSQEIVDGTISPHVVNINLGIPESFLIYCDIVDVQYFGDTMTKVLRVVNTLDKNLMFGETCYKEFNSPHYINLNEKKIEKIKIDIRDVTGSYLPFKFGVLTVKLHFKKQLRPL